MSITLKINTVDYTSQVQLESLEVDQNLTSQVDTASFAIKKYGTRSYAPAIGDVIEVYDGGSKIFGGTIISYEVSLINNAAGPTYKINCSDYSFNLTNILVSEVYTNATIQSIIADIISSYAPGYTTTNVSSSFTIARIVFNQINVMQCIKRLADVVKYEYYIDENKDVHFFPKFTNTAPQNLTDTSGNYINDTLKCKTDGSQIVNQVKVRGGEYNGATFTDIITVNGNNTLSFNLPYKFADLTVELDSGGGYVSKTVGIDFIDTFVTKNVLFNYEQRTIRFETALADGNKIRFSGKPKIPVLAIASDAASIALYGTREKLIRDTSIEDLDTARRRAAAEVQAFRDKQDEASFQTYTSGLRAGMVINLNSALRGIDVDYLIKRVRFHPFTPTTYIYDVDLVTTRKYYLTELLQKILEGDAKQADDSEVAEVIKTDIVELNIVESVASVASKPVNETVSFTSSFSKNPLGAGVEPTWVLGYYYENTPGNPLKMGLLDRSLKVY